MSCAPHLFGSTTKDRILSLENAKCVLRTSLIWEYNKRQNPKSRECKMCPAHLRQLRYYCCHLTSGEGRGVGNTSFKTSYVSTWCSGLFQGAVAEHVWKEHHPILWQETRQGQQLWRIEGEGGTTHPSNT